MNELFLLFCFLLVMIPILIGTQAFENMINQEEEDQLWYYPHKKQLYAW